MGIYEREKKYPMMLNFWHCTFAMPKYTYVISWLAGNSGEMVIYAFLLGSVWEEGMEWNKRNIFRILFPSLVWEF